MRIRFGSAETLAAIERALRATLFEEVPVGIAASRASAWAAEAKDAGKRSLDELFECFDKLDTAMHAGADEAKTTVADVHASVKERIEAAVKSLKETFSKEAK
jgi:gas vesicle protein